MFSRLSTFALLALSVVLPSLVQANDFAGANSYYLYAIAVSQIRQASAQYLTHYIM